MPKRRSKPGPKQDPSRPRSRAHRQSEGKHPGTKGRPRKDWSRVTHCVHGHEYTVENTYEKPDGQKVCRTCQAEASRKYSGRPSLSEVPRGVWNRNKTHCPQGHEYTEENTYWTGKNRRCKLCEKYRQAKVRYGLSPEELDALGVACWVCGAEEDVHTDHDHVSGRVRGRLCNNCNNGIGRFEDNPVLLRAAADYLEMSDT